jgi:hypothetical protein
VNAARKVRAPQRSLAEAQGFAVDSKLEFYAVVQ